MPLQVKKHAALGPPAACCFPLSRSVGPYFDKFYPFGQTLGGNISCKNRIAKRSDARARIAIDKNQAQARSRLPNCRASVYESRQYIVADASVASIF